MNTEIGVLIARGDSRRHPRRVLVVQRPGGSWEELPGSYRWFWQARSAARRIALEQHWVYRR